MADRKALAERCEAAADETEVKWIHETLLAAASALREEPSPKLVQGIPEESLELARKALEAVERHKNDDVDEWAARLAADLVKLDPDWCPEFGFPNPTALREGGESVASEEEVAALERVVAGLDGGGFYKDRDTLRGLITKFRHPHTEDESDES